MTASRTTSELIAELDALEAKAVRAPWKITFDGDHYSKKDGVYIGGNPTGALGGWRELGTFFPTYCKPTPQVEFVCALRNAYPQLRAELQAALEDAARYRYLREHGCGIESGDTDLWNANEALDAAIDAAISGKPK